MTILLIFDVETTGLLPKSYKPGDGIKNISQFPNIIQLSYILYDLEQNKLLETYNQYIKQKSDHIDVHPDITKLTGISTEMLKKQGVPITDVLEKFVQSYLKCDSIIAHNLMFDSTMIIVEAERNCKFLGKNNYNLFANMFNKQENTKKLECTMQMTVNFCNLERVNSRGVYKKLPKLSELYQILFDKIQENLHNSIVDVFVCLRCYLKYKYQIDIDDESFSKMIESNL